MRNRFNSLVLAMVSASVLAPVAHAQSSSGFPYSIITPDASERRAAKRPRRAPPPQVRPAEREATKTPTRRIRRGSSTASTIPTYRSPLTPLGTVQPMPTAPSMAYPSSPASPVPGVAGSGGMPAVAPSRPAGQTFPDRTSRCIASGTAQGVGPGQIGSFTQNCVGR